MVDKINGNLRFIYEEYVWYRRGHNWNKEETQSAIYSGKFIRLRYNERINELFVD